MTCIVFSSMINRKDQKDIEKKKLRGPIKDCINIVDKRISVILKIQTSVKIV